LVTMSRTLEEISLNLGDVKGQAAAG
jgi:hypothetical protein